VTIDRAGSEEDLNMQMAGTMNVTTPSDREIQMTRVFDAPRKVVWLAMSRPELIKRWLMGPPGWEMVQCDDDQRVGGAFVWCWRGPDGQQQFSMRGVYREVVPGERVVRTEIFDFPGCMPPMAEQVATLELSEDAGGTLLTLTVEFPSKQARDAAVASGMKEGVSAGHDRLAALIAEGAVGVEGFAEEL
jgi:uncharacterized protein YndB with AHSA1/START domain